MIFNLVGCSIDVNQPVVATVSAENPVAFPTSGPGADQPTPPSGSSRPVTWAGLNLTGRLVYTRVSSNDDVSALSVETLDLVTGEIKTIFTAPEDAWIYYSAVSPDGSQLVISYVPPSETNPNRNQALYILPMDGSAPPHLLITPPTEFDQYIQVEWSADGKYLYYVYNNYKNQPANQIYPNYKIFRMVYPDGQPEQIAENAFWPRVSPDSASLVYVALDPNTGTGDLIVANTDGTNAHAIKTGGSDDPGIKDAPIFSPDGESILFSAPSPQQSYKPNWLDQIMGVQIGKAHSVPSDWWSVAVTGGEATRLTSIQSTSLFGSIAPDKEHLVSFSLEGLFVMELDGSNLTALIPDPGGSTVDWLP